MSLAPELKINMVLMWGVCQGKITGLSITLHELHKVIESAIMELHPEESGQMDFKTRRRPLINYQHSFALIAWEKLGYSKTEVARYRVKIMLLLLIQ
ncbi:MAG: hypothetical protein CM15mV42_1790 [uncultured marine virus]|nr:MAG: hypothetical protein CM15mV42_1790 [uncultured marine virus]